LPTEAALKHQAALLLLLKHALRTSQNNVQEIMFIGMIHAETSKIFISNVCPTKPAPTISA
jgi:hypothetical protein